MAQVRETCGDRAKCLEGRIRLINVWRPIGSTVYHEPLALADWRSVCVDDDLLPLRVIYACQDIQTVTCRYSNSHRWYYLKEQVRGALLVILASFSDYHVNTRLRRKLRSLSASTAVRMVVRG